MSIQKPLDLATGLFLLFGSIFLFNESYSIRDMNNLALGAAFFPRVLLGIIGTLSAVLVFQSFGKDKRDKKEKGELDALEKQGVTLQWAYMGLLLLYILCMPYVGYLPATLLFCFITMCVIGPKTPKKIALYAVASAVTAFGLHHIFGTMLSLFLP